MLSLRSLPPRRLVSRLNTRSYTPTHHVQNQSERRVSPTEYNVQIMAASNRGYFNDCLTIAGSMKAAGVEPETPTYNALMNTAARNGSWLFAWAIFDDMLFAGVQPTSATFAHLIHAQRDRPYINLWKAIDRMNEFGIKPNAPIYSSIINCLVKTNNIETALKYVFLMKRQNIVPELNAAQSVVVLAAECGHSRLAIEIAKYFEHISIRQLEGSAWVACLASAAQNLYLEGVQICWPRVVDELNIVPNEGVCVAVLNTAARNGLPDLATDVLRVLKLADVHWQEYHFAALIEAFCRNDQLKEALVTLHIMHANGVEPTDTTANFLVDTIKRDVDTLDAAWSCIDEIHTSDAGLDIEALKVVIKASIFLGDLQRAVGVYRSFQDYGLTRDVSTYNLLLEGCVGAHHRHLGDLILDDMKEAKVKPDQETYDKMIHLCLTQDTYEDAFYYLEEMKAATYLPPREIYEALLEKCLSAEDPRSSLVLQEMAECGYKPLDSRHNTAATAIHINKKRREERK